MTKPQWRDDVASKPLLAFAVTTTFAEASVLVWAHSVAQAKSLALSSLWLDDSDWTDLKVKREPKADGRRDHACVMDDDCKGDDLRLMRDLGWQEIDGASEPCKRCDRFPWRDVSGSALNDDGLCAECVEANSRVRGDATPGAAYSGQRCSAIDPNASK